MEVTHRQSPSSDDPDVRDRFPVLVQSLDGCDDVVHVFAVEHAAVDRKADDIAQLFLLFRSLEIVFHRIVAQFGSTDAVTADQFDREALSGKFLMISLSIKELRHVDIDTVSSGRQYDTFDSGLVEALS